MSVVKACEDSGPCLKKLTIEVPAEAVQAEMGRVLTKYRRQLKLPGFRPGKVPVALVRQRFREDIEQEVAERLAPRYWNQAQSELDLDTLLPPRFERPTVEEGEPMTLVASVEVRPPIELGEYRDFELPEEDPEPTEKEIEDALTDLRRQHAEWRLVDRPAARGDLVIATMQPLAGEDEEEIEAEPRKIHLELGEDGLDEELTLALTGLAAGQGTEYRARGEEGEPGRNFRIEIEEVQEQELPELDDELAAKFGDFESVDDLREAVRKNLHQRKDHDLRNRRRHKLLEQLRERHPMALPDGVVRQEGERLLQRYAEQMASQGVDLERAEIDWEGLMGQLRPEAERQVHDRLLLDAVAEAEEIRLDESKFERFLSGLAARQGATALQLRQQLAESGRLEPLRGELLREQTLGHLLGEDDGDAGGSDDETAAASAASKGSGAAGETTEEEPTEEAEGAAEAEASDAGREA
jgi:trigger factor